MTRTDAPPRWDHWMHRRLVQGEAAALGELYDRFGPLVHGLAHRVLGADRAADALTREVFAHVWQHPGAYDPDLGPLRPWLTGLTRRLAVRRLRATAAAGLPESGADVPGELEDRVRRASVAARADSLVHSLPVPLRAALELAYFQRRDYRRTAAELGITEDEARRRLRLGLRLLSTARNTGGSGAPPGPGTPA
ncbi:sigma-70 family RNA polymerase sigma factor [Streptomyces sp. NPDC047017]|uniref:sigma-70 family RNA polymerase sigma factor n=1 Tax=Streptomyces sp. NPDC047017 TaxID=3155024 RepID=UPI0034003CD5